MKKMIVFIAVVVVLVMGIGYVKENRSDFTKNIGDYVVEIDTKDGFSFDIHEHGFMDDVCEFMDDASEIISDGIDDISIWIENIM